MLEFNEVEIILFKLRAFVPMFVYIITGFIYCSLVCPYGACIIEPQPCQDKSRINLQDIKVTLYSCKTAIQVFLVCIVFWGIQLGKKIGFFYRPVSF